MGYEAYFLLKLNRKLTYAFRNGPLKGFNSKRRNTENL